MAHESGKFVNELEASRRLLLEDKVELAVLKRRVDILMNEISGVKRTHRDLKKYVKRSWKEKLYDLFRRG